MRVLTLGCSHGARVGERIGEYARVALYTGRADDVRMPVVPKFQKCKTCGERVPTKFEIKGDEVEYPGIHFCPNGHGL